ncbi:MAG: PEP-CTERM sorting domain-containing protein [Thiobacillaceae bacterium]|jgi:hypothetical protein|nr:PEP-CTERM sorting domain-containing protein [Thiobacillaceae bacterium]
MQATRLPSIFLTVLSLAMAGAAQASVVISFDGGSLGPGLPSPPAFQPGIQPGTLTFDDLDASSGVETLPENYAGLDWDYSTDWAMGWQVWATMQNDYPAASAPNVVFAWSNSIGVSLPMPAVFKGAYFGGSAQVGYELSLAGTAVHTTSYVDIGSNGDPAVWVASGYTGLVDRVQVLTNGNGQDWVMDNFTTAPVPEPETYLMMLSGLGMLAWAARRRKRA